MSHIRLPGKRLVKCKACGGAGFTLIEGHEYICQECNGRKNKWIDSTIDIETLALMIKEKLEDGK